MFDFPASPSVGTTTTTPSGTVFTWDGTKWTAASGTLTEATADARYVNVTGDVMTGPLNISGGGGSATLQLSTSASGGTATDGFLVAASAGVVNLWNYEATPVVLATSGSERLRVDPSGFVGVGISAPGYNLHVRWQAAAGGVATAIHSGPNGADSSTYMMLFGDYSQAAIVGAITRSGTNSVAYGTTSDERLKQEIGDTSRGIDALMSLRVRDYRMGGTHEQGLVAQEVAWTYPEAIHKGGDDPATDPWLIDYGRLTPLLIKAVQELEARVQALEEGKA